MPRQTDPRRNLRQHPRSMLRKMMRLNGCPGRGISEAWASYQQRRGKRISKSMHQRARELLSMFEKPKS